MGVIRHAAWMAAALALPVMGAATVARPPRQAVAAPWNDIRKSPDERAAMLVDAMTQAEKLSIVFGLYSTDSPSKSYTAPADGRACTAGFVPGIPRLGIQPQWLTDAGIGVSTHRTCKTPRGRTALPSGLASAATWNPELAYQGGAMIGREARLSGHNVLLAGGINLVREPRNGRNFEYAGEDPLLAGRIVGQAIRGIESNHIVSTLKHFAFNDQETNRFTIDVKIDPASARLSDLLAFQIAIEDGRPGSVMCSYNRYHGAYGCESPELLTEILKGDWRYPGYVMTDWGAGHSTIPAANAGLDQESGWPFDRSPYFGEALAEAVENGHVSQARLDDMARRILRSLFASGAIDDPIDGVREDEIDFVADGRISQAAAEEAIVLLRNERDILPLATTATRILTIGGHADKGVLSGGGSSQVYPVGGMAVANEGPDTFPGPMVFHPSSPVAVLRQRVSGQVDFLDGKDVAAAAAAAREADLVIVFATQWMGESIDAPDLSLPSGQDALIAAVAAANPNTIVVLETGGPVLMPWLDQTAAVLEAWYPGTSGGEAIARVLTGEVNPSGRLPVTFPADLAQLPRPIVDGDRDKERAPASVDYDIEGAAVGYKWFDKRGRTPLFPFGYGLSYGSYTVAGLVANRSEQTFTASFAVRNTGGRALKPVPQLYVSGPSITEAPQRLAGWRKVTLQPGERQTVSVTIDPRLFATFDAPTREWRIAAGRYRLQLRDSATADGPGVTIALPARRWRDTDGKP